MSDSSAYPARPVSVVTTLAIVALCALFLVVVNRFYHPASATPQNSAAENLTPDLAWKATPQSRVEALKTLREAQQKQATSYAWVDQKTGVVQLPVERAMQLTAEKYGAKK